MTLIYTARYFTPPEDMSFGHIGALLRLGATAAAILGVLVILTAVLYLAWQVLLMFSGKGMKQGTVKTIAWGLIVGILLAGTGWIGILEAARRTLAEPAQKIMDSR